MLKIRKRLMKIIDEREDSVIIFSAWEKRWLSKSVMGKEKNAIDNFV